MRWLKALTWIVAACAVAAVVTVGVLTRARWEPLLFPAVGQGDDAEKKEAEDAHAHGGKHVDLTPQAQKSLDLDVRPLNLTTAARHIELPGEVVELPGHSDRHITSPVAAVVRRVYHAPWQTVKPGEKLFTLGLVSEFLLNSQTELYKATRELVAARRLREMQEQLVKKGAGTAARLLELEIREKTLEAAVQSNRFELASRGLTPEQIDKIAKGEFVTSVDIVAPEPHAAHPVGTDQPHDHGAGLFEVQAMKVQVGEQVRPGQLLALLTEHQHLAVEGHGFRSEVPLLEEVAREGTPVRAEWLEEPRGDWPRQTEGLQIRTLANVVEPGSQTVSFYVPLENQFREYERDGKTYRVWRYRPGQRVRLSIPVREVKGVFKLPAGAVVREGVEHYVFRQNGDVFQRVPVRVLFEDRRHAIVANDGSVSAGQYVVHNNAAALQRALTMQGQEHAGHGHGHDHPH